MKEPSDSTLLKFYVGIQIFSVLAAFLNFLVAINSFWQENYLALVINLGVAFTLIYIVIRNHQTRACYTREIEQCEHAEHALLQYILRRGICPDCGEPTLDRNFVCHAHGCGSRFSYDQVTKQWSRE
jgi:dipeptide/tripeptide permease